MTDELVRAWMFGDGELRLAIENVLARDPDDVAVRFVALCAYYHLATLAVTEKEEEITDQRRGFWDYLGYLVRLRISAVPAQRSPAYGIAVPLVTALDSVAVI